MYFLQIALFLPLVDSSCSTCGFVGLGMPLGWRLQPLGLLVQV